MDLGLTGKTALVIGSTSGLGLAVARALADEGALVSICGRRGDLASTLAGEIPGATGYECDLAAPGAVEKLAADVARDSGAVDILVLNSGGPAPGPATSLTTESLQGAMDMLLMRQIELASHFLPAMRASGWGRILGLGSSGVQQPIPGLATSNIARAALAGYLKTLAAEVAADGVTVNMLLPGRIDTDRVDSLDKSRAEREQTDVELVRARSRASIPVGRYGTPSEFAAVAAFLCSQLASYVTGEQVRCDGGLVGAY
jgi:3-oxoacyl-[acyl-carrier protein] reductase